MNYSKSIDMMSLPHLPRPTNLTTNISARSSMSHFSLTAIDLSHLTTMASLKTPARLPELVKATFSKALADGDLFYFSTHVQDMRVGSLSVSPCSHSPHLNPALSSSSYTSQ